MGPWENEFLNLWSWDWKFNRRIAIASCRCGFSVSVVSGWSERCDIQSALQSRGSAQTDGWMRRNRCCKALPDKCCNCLS